MEDKQKITTQEIRKHIQEQDWIVLERILAPIHPADIAELLEALSTDDQIALFQHLPLEVASEVFDEISDLTRQALLAHLGDEYLADVLETLPMDDGAELIALLPKDRATTLLTLMVPERAVAVQQLLKYPRDSAGRLMRTDMAVLQEDWSVRDAVNFMRSVPPDKTFYHLYVVDTGGTLVGRVLSRSLLLANSEDVLTNLMLPPLPAVHPDTDQEEVARLVAKYDVVAVPVLDQQERLLGVVTVDDVLDVIRDEATEDFQRLGGSQPLERSYFGTPAWVIARKRVGWLLLLFVAGAFTGVVTEAFELVWTQIVVLALFVPLIIDTGGNTGSQTVATIIRAMSVGEVSFKSIGRALQKEVSTALFLGLILFVAGLLFAVVLFRVELGVALAIALTLFVVVLWSTTIGTLIPITAEKLGLDAAVVSAPLITSIVDVTGLIIYYSLAGFLLGVF